MSLAQARETLAKNRRDALAYADRAGAARVRRHLKAAERDLVARLRLVAPDSATFTAERLRATLVQVRHVLAALRPGMLRATVDTGLDVGEMAAGHAAEYLARVDRAFRGAGVQALALDEAAMLDAGRVGARSSILRRLALSGEMAPGAEAAPHAAKRGILDRYGMNVIDHFENELRVGVLARKPFEEVRDALVERSPFLQGAPAHWAERIVRTESMGSYGRAAWEANREADEQLGDMVKILSATFDSRTACLLGETRVSAGMVRAVFRRWYEGPTFGLVTESGRDFTATPNHPVLTRRGWVSAGDLRLGDDLICDTRYEHPCPTRQEHVADRPPTIGEVFEALSVLGHRERRRGRQEDFHGDGSDRDVDVLRPDDELRLGPFTTLDKPFLQGLLAPSHDVWFCRCGAAIGPGARGQMERLCAVAEAYSIFNKAPRDQRLRGAKAFADFLDRLTSLVGFGDVIARHTVSIPGVGVRIGEPELLSFGIRPQQSSHLQCFRDIAEMIVQRCGHLSERHPGKVKLDRLVDIQRCSFRGHVFDLSTSDGYFTASGVYTGNSDSYAVHGQIRRPDEAFETWYGPMQHPPARPNDREIVVPHRISWPIPRYLAPRDRGEVVARWAKEGRKGVPPPTPRDSTVDRRSFGAAPPPKVDVAGEGRR